MLGWVLEDRDANIHSLDGCFSEGMFDRVDFEGLTLDRSILRSRVLDPFLVFPVLRRLSVE